MGRKKKVQGLICPKCGGELEYEGQHTIADDGGRWEIDSDRYVCPNGHTLFIGDSVIIQEAEEISDIDSEFEELEEEPDEDEDEDEDY